MTRRLLLTACLLLLWSVPAPAWRAVSLVKSATGGLTNDLVIDFGSATSASNIVVAGVRLANDTATVDVGGVTEDVLHTAVNGTSFQVMILCFAGGAQTYTFTTTGTVTAGVGAAEFSGTDGCTEDGTSDHVISTTSPIAADSPPTIQAGSLVFSTVWSGNNADYSCSGDYACIPTDGTDIGSTGLAQWRVAPSTAAYYGEFTFTGTENSLLMVVGIASAGGGGTTPRLLMLLGVGE
jgi:hypothetical protein